MLNYARMSVIFCTEALNCSVHLYNCTHNANLEMGTAMDALF